VHLLETLRAARLLAIVRGTDAGGALRTVLALAEEGITLVEVSLTGTDALGVLSRARAELGSAAPLGAGTVLTAEDARRAQESGADFAVTPGLGEGFDEARRIGLPVLAGALTPTEVAAAVRLGADAVKLFPAGPVGGPGYLRALRGPFPGVPFVPVGGVDAQAARDHLAAGAVAVGVGSPLVGDAADGGDLGALRDRARAYRRIAEEAGR
jgi:2-dehydro-3-deoxyphosphogluconate aldolase/(4S)-4-hydroxy-2-oxoglutarate aldolase